MEDPKFTEEQVIQILTYYVLQNGYHEPDVKNDLEIQHECVRLIFRESGSQFEIAEVMYGDGGFEVTVDDTLCDEQWSSTGKTEEEALWSALFRYVQGMDDYILTVIESYT